MSVPITPELVLRYIRADAIGRAALAMALPDVFDDSMRAAVDAADEELAAAVGVASDVRQLGLDVDAEAAMPSAAFPAQLATEAQARAMFEASLAALIAEQFTGADDDEEDAAAAADAAGMTTGEAVFTVLPAVCEFAGGRAAFAAAATCKLWRGAVLGGQHARPLWLGLAMREHGAAAQAVVAARGMDAMLSLDWSVFVAQQLRGGGDERADGAAEAAASDC